jgi:hypothetical protein
MSENYTTKEHLEAHHAAAASHHEAMAENENAKAQHDRDLADAHEELDQSVIAKIHKAYAVTHERAAAHHAAEAKRHGSMQKMAESITTTKGMSSMDLNRLVPDNVRGVIPIPRTGQRQLDKAVIDPEFEHILGFSPEPDL